MVFLSNSFVFKENRLSSPGSRTPAKVPDRFFEEFDYERRLKKRKLKLLAATEEAFAHLARVSQERIKGIFSDILNAVHTFQTILKFLRLVLQCQPMQTVIFEMVIMPPKLHSIIKSS